MRPPSMRGPNATGTLRVLEAARETATRDWSPRRLRSGANPSYPSETMTAALAVRMQ